MMISCIYVPHPHSLLVSLYIGISILFKRVHEVNTQSKDGNRNWSCILKEILVGMQILKSWSFELPSTPFGLVSNENCNNDDDDLGSTTSKFPHWLDYHHITPELILQQAAHSLLCPSSELLSLA